MLFKSYKRAPYRRPKTNWLSPRTLGLGFMILSLGLMLFLAYNPAFRSSFTYSRLLLMPSAAIQSARNFFTALGRNVMDNYRAKSELSSLRDEMETLRAENAVLRFTLRRHEAYVEALHFPKDESFTAIPAVVLGRDERISLTLFINRGAKDGLIVNLPVRTPIGLVGRTCRIDRDVSLVQSLTDPGSAIGVYVKDTSYEGVLKGTDDGKKALLTDLQLIGSGDESLLPKPGQAVYTSGAGLVFPRDLPAGYISHATSPGGYLVEPAVDFKTVQAVQVIKSSYSQEEALPLITDK